MKIPNTSDAVFCAIPFKPKLIDPYKTVKIKLQDFVERFYLSKTGFMIFVKVPFMTY